MQAQLMATAEAEMRVTVQSVCGAEVNCKGLSGFNAMPSAQDHTRRCERVHKSSSDHLEQLCQKTGQRLDILRKTKVRRQDSECQFSDQA